MTSREFKDKNFLLIIVYEYNELRELMELDFISNGFIVRSLPNINYSSLEIRFIFTRKFHLVF